MNPEEILASKAKRIAVIAAPGSGKTKRILLPKAVRLLADPRILPSEVLLLSFSRLSAKDLKQRVEGLGDRAPRAATVHSLCLSFLLSENDHEIRSRVESVLLDFEKEALLWDLKLVFPKVSKPELGSALKAFSAGWATQPHDDVFEESEFQHRFKAAVVSWLSEHQACMMEEIVYEAVALARKLGTAEFIRKPRYILVDEYQDLNRLEQEFVELLATESELLLAVGDPNQSIYGFKYSYPQGINDYAAQAEGSWKSLTTGRCPGPVVAIANQLILQANPGTTDLLDSLRPAEGEVRFVVKDTQPEEFQTAAQSISNRLRGGAKPEDILVLVPKRKLGKEFVDFVNANKATLGIQEQQKVVFESKLELSEKEQERILLFGLTVRPSSLLRARVFLGLGDTKMMADEVRQLKVQYGNLETALVQATPDDFPIRQTRIRRLCGRIAELRAFLRSQEPAKAIDDVLNELLPDCDPELDYLRSVVQQVRESDDTIEDLYLKVLDQLRAVPTDANTIRVMTIMASKGLEAPHVWILGCNSGNLPGEKRNMHMTDHEFRAEQRRFLFVAVTRASLTLTISWARHLPFGQAKQHHTQGIGFNRSRGQPRTVVGMSPFLADLNGITWER